MSKQWWDISRQLVNNAPPREAIPPLKLGGVWDQLPGRVLRECADELSLPLCLLLRRMLTEGCWPSVWRKHWVAPIHKKKSKADPNNYCGVHLTPVLSKIAERALGEALVAVFEGSGAYGETQFAFRRRHGVKDLVTLFVAD